MQDLTRQYDLWQEAGASKDRRFPSDVALEVRPLYTPIDLKERGFDYLQHLALPGFYPFTRGITPNMYTEDLPLIKIYSGFGLSEESNERYKKLIDWGVDEIQIAVDLPTQIGYDSDDIMATAEVGKVGVAIDSLRDMEILFNEIPLNRLKRVSMLGNSFGPIALALFIALGEKQGLKPEQYTVSLQNDVLKEYIARGTYIYPIKPAVRMACDVVEYCVRNCPHWYPLTCCANHICVAGAGSTKATAFALANASYYIEELLGRGLSIDQFGHLLDMFLDERDDFFVAVANLRATRRVWAHLMHDKYGAKETKSMALKITAYGHGRETLQEPLNNIVRIGLASLAYFLGGIQFLYDASYDECSNTPSDESVKVAIRTLQIIFEEFGIRNTIDPLGGSYYVESLTSDIEQGIWAELEKVGSAGGALAAIENGYYKKLITEGAARRQRRFEAGERVSIGVNKLASSNSLSEANFRPNPEAEKIQIRKLQELKLTRNQRRVVDALQWVAESAKNECNVVPATLEAVRAYATIGEICNTLRGVYGEYQDRGGV